VSSLNTPEACLTEQERAHVIRLLYDSQTEFLALTAALSDAQWIAKPAPDRWSVQQTAEHLVLGEAGMQAKIEEALAHAPDPEWAAQAARKATFLDRVLPDRSRKVAAPAPLHPHHQWTREETMARYQAGRAMTLQLAAAMGRPLKSHCAEHPFPVFNLLNAHHWLLYIPLHNTRHNQQIAEILREIAP
jgi:hypothetical protein